MFKIPDFSLAPCLCKQAGLDLGFASKEWLISIPVHLYWGLHRRPSPFWHDHSLRCTLCRSHLNKVDVCGGTGVKNSFAGVKNWKFTFWKLRFRLYPTRSSLVYILLPGTLWVREDQGSHRFQFCSKRTAQRYPKEATACLHRLGRHWVLWKDCTKICAPSISTVTEDDGTEILIMAIKKFQTQAHFIYRLSSSARGHFKGLLLQLLLLLAGLVSQKRCARLAKAAFQADLKTYNELLHILSNTVADFRFFLSCRKMCNFSTKKKFEKNLALYC